MGRTRPGPDRPRSKRALRQQVRRGFECARLRDRTCRKNATVLFTVKRGAGVPDVQKAPGVGRALHKKELCFRDRTRPNALSDQTIQCFNRFHDFNQLPGTKWPLLMAISWTTKLELNNNRTAQIAGW